VLTTGSLGFHGRPFLATYDRMFAAYLKVYSSSSALLPNPILHSCNVSASKEILKMPSNVHCTTADSHFPQQSLPTNINKSHSLSRAVGDEPPPYHNWEEAVPDTSTLPPPPAFSYLYSNTGNASPNDAERAHCFCDNKPLWKPVRPSEVVYKTAQKHDFRPIQPPELNGTITLSSTGRWRGKTRANNGDCLLSTHLPLYFSAVDSPFVTKRKKMIYFEVRILSLSKGSKKSSNDASGLSIGFIARPYPTWRSPGWERGSVGVFSDDGCRFVNDSYGGREFTTAFKIEETIGLGMTFSEHAEIFLTRDGREAGRWDLHEEADEEAGSVEGLEGNFDLYGAVGLFGGVEFDVCFDKAGWLWQTPL
jgi:hypothetical protein